jgi:CO/xanthine dehydrogenase FAD-binding subunit
MWNHYFTPKDIREALDLLEQYPGQSRLIAGGSDLVLDLSYGRVPSVDVLVDISSIPALKKIKFESGMITIGSAVTLSEIIQSDILKSQAPILVNAARTIAGPQIRNVATIGGNVVNASPAADMVPPLLVLESTVSIIQPNHITRQLPIQEFLKGYRAVNLNSGEIVTGFIFHSPLLESRSYFRKVQPRRSMAIAMLNLAILLETEDNRISNARIAMGAVAPTAVRVKSIEHILRNLPVEKAANPEIYEKIITDIAPISDFRASQHYRTQVAQRLLREAVNEILRPTKN